MQEGQKTPVPRQLHHSPPIQPEDDEDRHSIKSERNEEGRHLLACIDETFHSPPDEVWPFLSAIGTERIFVPGCTRSSLVEGSGEGALRRLHFGPVNFLDERILELSRDAYTLRYIVVNKKPPDAPYGVVKLYPVWPHLTRIVWEV